MSPLILHLFTLKTDPNGLMAVPDPIGKKQFVAIFRNLPFNVHFRICQCTQLALRAQHMRRTSPFRGFQSS